MPLMAVIAAVGVEFDAVEGPGQLRAGTRFLLRSIGIFGRTVSFEMR